MREKLLIKPQPKPKIGGAIKKKKIIVVKLVIRQLDNVNRGAILT